MKKLNETIVSELLQFFELTDEGQWRVHIYSKEHYANNNENIRIGSFIMLDRIGAFLLCQKIQSYSVKMECDTQVISIVLKDL